MFSENKLSPHAAQAKKRRYKANNQQQRSDDGMDKD